MYTKEQLASVAGMNKARLRKACSTAKIVGYSKMSVAEMRSAVQRHIEQEMKKLAPVVTTLAPVKLSGATKTDRIIQNGVKRPKDGGLCAQVWTALDAMRAADIDPSTKDVRDLAKEKSWNENNATAELSAWRKFNGISRSVLNAPAKETPAAKAAPPATRTDGSVDQYVA